MIGPYITALIILPMLIGILSVDVYGERISILELLRSDTAVVIIRSIESMLITNQTATLIEVDDAEDYKLQINLPETERALDIFNSSIAKGLTFLLFSIRDFGIWLGMATAPFHYLLAVLIAFSFLSPFNWLWIGSIFWVLTVERKEVYHVVTTGLRDAHLKTQAKSIVIEIGSGIKNKVRRN